MYNPVATYRIQFHKAFNFKEFESIIGYLQDLGVSTVYASPVFEATPGSTHGYDSFNPNVINPEIGTEEELKILSKKLNGNKIGWLQDIVPNHMAFDTRNPWLMDVLEKGPQSLYAHFFDTAWSSTFFQGHIMVPFLGAPLNEVIEKGELKLSFDGHQLVLQYFESMYPLRLRSYVTVLHSLSREVPTTVQQLIKQMADAEQAEEKHVFAERFKELQLQFAALMENSDTKGFLKSCIEHINADKSLLKKLADEQLYRLCHWQETDYKINYRRFFTVNGLICLNIQNKEVLEQHHALIKKLVDERVFKGLRIDHIDGLYDPAKYLNDLRQLAGNEAYINVEKILAKDEGLPPSWPVQGNTGYDFLSMVNNLFTQQTNEKAFTDFYQQLTGDAIAIEKQLRDKKSLILYQHMSGELDNLYQYFMSLSLVKESDYAQMRTEDIRTAIAEFLIHCPVYRYYSNTIPLSHEDAVAVKEIFKKIIDNREDLKPAVDLLEKVLLQKSVTGNEEYRQNALKFYQRCMQFSGPLMAKGVEDTLMYNYNRFIAHNEVGDSPGAFGLSVADFHKKMKERQANWPLTLNATATHDTKRGEDARARLNVLSELPDEWFEKVKEWQGLNKRFKRNDVPNANDEYFIYQSLIGASPSVFNDVEDFKNRFAEYFKKAFREAKTASNWSEPNERYELAIKDFATTLLDNQQPFFKSFQSFLSRISDFGIINSLSQVILKFLCPGVPDVYQGCELWDHSFVDPDNRRPVDFQKRKEFLADIQKEKDKEKLIADLWNEKENGKIKLWLTHLLFHERKNDTQFFEEADYQPLKTKGKYKDHLLAFARITNKQCIVVCVPLHLAILCKQQEVNVQSLDWADTSIVLPHNTNNEVQDVLLQTGYNFKNEIPVKRVFKILPFALLKSTVKANKRGAGILMHISSLPSPFGIGDLGPQAKAFATFLKNSYQKYWQLLPVNPTQEGQAHSPYSAVSSMAGNTLFISPELLLKEGLINRAEVLQSYLPAKEKVDFDQAEKVKSKLLSVAWQAFQEGKAQHFQNPFEIFCVNEKDWLNDYALYVVLKKQFDGKPWFDWDEAYKNRDVVALKKFSETHKEELQKVKWLQFLFAKQWKELKDFCNQNDIKLVGDLPFYVSYDSADVWAAQELFSIDKEGKLTAMAGVPPDAFSEDGQLWGMPVYNWNAVKQQDYQWWIKRLLKNIELFDIVRLDHFRAFAEYWEVPAGEATAKNGSWKKGPGKELFNALKKHLGRLPFLAEDLGDITDDVYLLRDEFELPGMKVLQFAFGDETPFSIHTPHNYSNHFYVYTGTHDNPTIKGWYKTSESNVEELEKYVGRKLSLNEVNREMIQLAYASVAETAIIPLQDVLGLDDHTRMNTPATSEGNWLWRLVPGQLTTSVEEDLKSMVLLYNRR